MINITQSASRTKEIVGYRNGKVFDLPLICLRKVLTTSDLSKIKKHYFCFTSNYQFSEQAHRFKPVVWLHCHRDPSAFSTAPRYLMSESDFLDTSFFPSQIRPKKYDYVYFTGNDYPSGYFYKGFDNFLKILPVLHSMQLKGIVIVYVFKSDKWVFPLSEYEKELLKLPSLKIKFKNLTKQEVSQTMAESKFCIFPNKTDCSPRMIPESFINNIPILMNKDILGGWKYIEETPELGRFFNPMDSSSVQTAIEQTLSLPNNQKEIWMSKYGFWRSSEKLANIIKQNIDLKIDFSHCYFKEFAAVFKTK
jgi:glycosyltransferase involved in cell wall biosynthesis